MKTTVMSIKMTTDERQRMEKAAGGYPVSTWARIELLKIASGSAKQRTSGLTKKQKSDVV